MSSVTERLHQTSLVQSLIVGMILAATYFFAAYDSGDKLLKQISTMQESITAKKDQLVKLKNADAEKEKTSSQINALTEDFKTLIQYIPTDLNQADLMRTLVEEARVVGVKNVRIQPQRDARKENTYEALMIDMSFEGTFSQGMSFLSNLTKLPRIINTERLEIQLKGKDKLEPEGYAQVPSLVFHAILAGYRYIPEPVAKAEEKGAKREK